MVVSSWSKLKSTDLPVTVSEAICTTHCPGQVLTTYLLSPLSTAAVCAAALSRDILYISNLLILVIHWFYWLYFCVSALVFTHNS